MLLLHLTGHFITDRIDVLAVVMVAAATAVIIWSCSYGAHGVSARLEDHA